MRHLGHKPVIGMVHLRALPGAPAYDAAAGVEGIVEAALHDLAALQNGGVDAVLFGNELDRPYELRASQPALAAMAAAIGRLRAEIRVPFGVDYLWDPVATVALAAATGAAFAREVFTGIYAADMGHWAPAGAEAFRLRAALGRRDLLLLANVNAEFATSLDTRPLVERARSAAFSSDPDVLCVSGPMTGQGVEMTGLAAVRAAVDRPVLANTGVTVDTVEAILAVADGCIVGTHFKRDGDTWNPVDPDRVARFMRRVADCRGRRPHDA